MYDLNPVKRYAEREFTKVVYISLDFMVSKLINYNSNNITVL